MIVRLLSRPAFGNAMVREATAVGSALVGGEVMHSDEDTRELSNLL